MIMTLVALTGAVSHISLGAQLFPLPMAIVVASCLLGAVVSAKFANRCEIRRLNRIVGVVLILLGAVTILIKLLQAIRARAPLWSAGTCFSPLGTKIVPYLTKNLNFMKFFRHLQRSTRFYSILC